MNKRDYYEILGVSKDANENDIKSAFRKLAKKYHPDVSSEPDAEEKFKEAQEAYAVLGDASKRSQYDQFGHEAFSQNSGGAGGFDFSGFDFSDIFGDIFGDMGFGFGGRRSGGSRARKGNDKLLRIRLPFEEAVSGTQKTINVDVNETCDECDGKGGFDETSCSMCRGSGYVASEQRTLFGAFMTKTTCSTCSGNGKTYAKSCTHCQGKGTIHKNKDIEVKIPAGVDSGNQLRIAGKGEAGSNGGPNGDIYLEFIVEEHPLFIRDENDIYVEMPITITDAIFGAKKEVPTLTGTVKLTIPAGSESGAKHRLKGKGIEDVQTGRPGDLYVLLKVITPKKLSKEQKKLLEQLHKTNLEDSSEFKTFHQYL